MTFESQAKPKRKKKNRGEEESNRKKGIRDVMVAYLFIFN